MAGLISSSGQPQSALDDPGDIQYLPSLAGTGGLRVSALGLGFVTNVVLARILGVEGYGILSYVLAWVGLFGAVGTFGLDRLLVRVVAVYKGQALWEKLRGLLGWAHLTAALVTLAVLGVGVYLSRFASSDLGPGLRSMLPVAGCFLLLVVLIRISGSALQGFNRIVTGQIGETLIQPGLGLALIAIIGIVMQWKLVPGQVLGLFVFSAGLAWIFSEWLLWKALPSEVHSSPAQYESRLWLAGALPLLMISALDMLNRQTSLLILGAYSGTDALGMYAVADRGAQLVAFPLTVVNLTLAPTFATLYHSENRAGLQRLVTRSARLVLVISAPIALALIIGSQWFLLLFGRDFIGGQAPLTILCIGQMVNAAMGSVGYLLIMTGHGRDAAVGIAAGAGVNLLLSALLIPHWGVNGAAAASAIGLIVWNVVLAVFVWKRVGITTTAFGRIPS